ncbi:hypothetical protein SU60_08605 [Vibrio mytili]|uniref:Uncharacterized protein n=1 Tax=Vibrio mytili TaxID=50718 RepID=A0A0C3I8E1_9VIBR|nr:hypothetical protein SU60_08605 [Vibrio mytili]
MIKPGSVNISGDIRDEVFVDLVLAKLDIQSLIHFSGLKDGSRVAVETEHWVAVVPYWTAWLSLSKS